MNLSHQKIQAERIHDFMKGSVDFKHVHSLPVCVYAKYDSGIYVAANKSLIGIAGLESASDILVKTDQELCWHDSSSSLRDNDLLVIQNQHPVCRIEPIIDCNQSAVDMLSFKIPFYDQNGIAKGILGVSIDSKSHKLSELFEVLTEVIRAFEKNSPPLAVEQFLSKGLDKKLSPQVLLARLTPREQECVQCLVKGLSAKETARVLGLSHRTVEVYYEKIKAKFGCRRKIEIVSLLYSD